MYLLYLNFANNDTHPLETLKKEYDEVTKSLNPLTLKGDFQVFSDALATPEKIQEYLTFYRDYIVLFHYAGHAGGGLLETLKGSTYAAGLARQLGKCRNLRCVILNGCSTAGQVADLLKEQVPVVIATSAPVNDFAATTFSTTFYQMLAGTKSIEEAFEEGIDACKLSHQIPALHRGAFSNEEEAADKTASTWGIFYENEDNLRWKLADLANQPIIAYKPNQHLIKVLAKAFSEYNDELKNILEQERQPGPKEDLLNLKKNEVLKCPPYPIAEQLRALFTENPGDTGMAFFDEPGLPRLEQLTTVYATTIKLMSNIMLAQLWEVLFAATGEAPPRIQEAVLKRMRSYLQQSQREPFSSVEIVRALWLTFQEISVTPFIGELAEMQEHFKEDSAFYDACLFFEQQYDHLFPRQQQRGLPDQQAKLLCPIAEERLATFFAPLHFLCRYQLASFKNIDVCKIRQDKKTFYQHKFVRLEGMLVNEKLVDRFQKIETFFDPTSVILIKGNFSKFEQKAYLNLSPFVIDCYAFEAKVNATTKLMFFDYVNKPGKALEYRHTYKPKDSPLRIPLGDEDAFNLITIKEQFEAFVQKLFNQPIAAL